MNEWYKIGVNYWDSTHGTDMWRYFDESVVRADLDALAKIGVKHRTSSCKSDTVSGEIS
ncbi:MAG: hypothetical protein MJ175_05025 [Clostridia bacterium]|nr:hypothetical protein [Clostridia bacterium]